MSSSPSSSSSSSSSSPCAACKLLRRKCTQGCVFAPYFPPDQPQKFAHVHRVFGASNVSKLLSELPPVHREDAVNSLAYEAKARVDDPVYGCVGYISLLQHKIRQLHNELAAARKELAAFIGPADFSGTPETPLSFHHAGGSDASQLIAAGHHHQFSPRMVMGLGLGISGTEAAAAVARQQVAMREHRQQLATEVQQLALIVATREQQELMRGLEQQHPHGFVHVAGAGNSADVISAGSPALNSGLTLVPALSLVDPFQAHDQQQQQQQQHRGGGDEVRNGVVGPTLS